MATSHRCRSKYLLLVGTKDETDPDPTFDPLVTDIGDEATVGDISSLHSLSGYTTSRSLQLTSSINGHQVRVLVDSGSTHNFLQPAIAETLKLKYHCFEF